MSVGFGFSLPALVQYGGGGNNPFGQLGPTLDLSFAGTVTDTNDPNGYTLNTNFIAPQYQVAADYTIWETNVGLVSKTFSQIITFTRASTATFTGSNGLIQSAAIDVPRFDYDPVTLAAKGLLIEEQRTNLLTYSEDFSNAAWTKSNATVTANATTSPDGATTADTLVEDTATATHYVTTPTVTVTSGVPYTFSCYVKAAGRSWVRFADTAFSNVTAFFNVATGVAGTIGSSVTANSITSVGNGWYRCTITYATTTTGSTPRINVASADNTVSYTGDGTSGLFIWGAQLEAGSFATSYIPTVASQVTRSADLASVNTLSPWFNATEGTLYAEGSALAVTQTTDKIIAALSTTAVSNTFELYKQSNVADARLYMATSGVVQADFTFASVFTAGTNAKLAAAYKVNDVAMSANAATVQTDTSATVPTITTLGIGSRGIGGGATWGGHIRRITYYPRKLSAAELQAITA
jgi:hypothetical protein